MSVSVKLGNDTLTGVDSVRLEDATSAGNYITFSLTSLPSTPTDAVIFYSLEPFTMKTNNNAKNWNGTLYYSTDYSTWNTWAGTNTLTAVQSDGYYKLYVRGSGNTYLTTGASSSTARWVFAGAGIKCYGNMNTLLSYTSPPISLTANYTFAYLFYQCSNVSFDVVLPATTLTEYCYYYMFASCTSLTTAPELPATTLTNYCYYYMFYNCTSLTTAPKIKATAFVSGATYSCGSMLYGCTSLVSLPALAPTTLTNYCYRYMFYGCTNIKLSTTQTGEYQTAYRIPTSGTGSAGTNSLQNMFTSTGGTLTGTPSINTTYYTSNTVVS